MGSSSIHSNRLAHHPVVAKEGMEKSHTLSPTAEKVAAVALSQDLPIQPTSTKKHEEKRSYVPMLCFAVGILVVVGCLYYRVVEVEEKKRQADLALEKANQIQDEAHELANVLCKNICKLLRADAANSDNVSKIDLTLYGVIQCEEFQGNDFCRL